MEEDMLLMPVQIVPHCDALPEHESGPAYSRHGGLSLRMRRMTLQPLWMLTSLVVADVMALALELAGELHRGEGQPSRLGVRMGKKGHRSLICWWTG